MKALIIDDLHPIIQSNLKEIGIESILNTSISKQELLKIIPNFQVLILRSRLKIDEEIIDAATNLKIIARAGAGLEKIDIKYAKTKGINCVASPEGNRTEVAEQTIGVLLNLLHKIRKSNQEVRQGIWNRDDNWGTTLSGQTVGIIGYGNMGSTFVSQLSGFNVKILAHDKYKTGFSTNLVQETTLKEVLELSNIISIHLPLTEETNYYVNTDFFDKLKKPIILLNSARGKNLNLKSLLTAIEKGQVIGAGLDVLEYESSNFESLFKNENRNPILQEIIDHPNIIVTPHIAGWTYEAYFKHSEILSQKIEAELFPK